MQWKGSNDLPIALVGKGICFDSGGLIIKNTHLIEMKWDKAGAGAIIGAMDVLSKLKLSFTCGCYMLFLLKTCQMATL